MKNLCLDTNILTYFFEKDPKFGSLAKTTVAKLQKNKIKLGFTFLSQAEILVHPYKLNDEDLINLYSNLESQFKIKLLYPTPETAAIAAQLRAKYTIQTPDAINLAVALSNKFDAFLTNDATLKKVGEIKIITLTDCPM